MRIWDIHPGYLNRQSLLGEHRELHGITAILSRRLKGYSRHPETIRWIGHGWALRQRHALLAAEMSFRGYSEHTPVRMRSAQGHWPTVFIDPPSQQFAILADKYRDKEPGRIPLPRSTRTLWSQHQHSVLVRDLAACRALEARVKGLRRRQGFEALALELVLWSRKPLTLAGLDRALQRVQKYLYPDPERWLAAEALLKQMWRGARVRPDPYFAAQVVLTELAACKPGKV